MKKPVICITMGDGAGIGPEIIMKMMKDPEVYEWADLVVSGDLKILKRAGGIIGADVEFNLIRTMDEAVFKKGIVNVFDLDLLPEDLPFGRISPAAGDAAYRYIEKAVSLANTGEIDVICTAPLNKEAMQKGGHQYPGHTEILADLTSTNDYAMLLSSPKLKVIHVTTHIGLIDAVNKIEPGRVYNVIRMAHDVLIQSGLEDPRIAVCGINPHAGENGLFGYGEEGEKLDPAIRKAKEEGINVTDPLPADTLFFRAVRGDFDIVVAMYHDQGHAPIKVLGLESGVNITVGLPILRTSVDHGTAFDIAGKGIADEASLKEAVRQGVEMAPAHSRNQG
ncbi:4-hydroxythreonine-4-phosphate dehydrogenase PdxA [Alteribacter natronophilus]|uniref:4-hydroxythreonine-4-phosphate dehydrogenase PdxA n=1 Tax=Alteribacter natronophilus TaxID=2583810 RepID=UPI00110D7574|nr:4-hydroxythreonine-4-phosphate dehydrogenase PdxA [Alteribacter natronophilus]TMW72265.1 4-hydroxythreonine-4-phosphate dehydrogenase PdxA [Alteribacter natronophilus]